jgi:4-amino-4-deoxy-L-arabinose transferase-like glycosyltransferase
VPFTRTEGTFMSTADAAPLRPSLPTIWARLILAFARTDVWLLTAGFAALVFFPWLGSVGLWDPWETHYSEVGRSMLERGDLVHPFWERSWFFSKPPLTPWLAALGLWAVGGDSGHGELPRYTEWGIRLPFALLATSAISLLSHAVGRLASRTAGLACGFVLATMPLYFFTARQAMTDMPFVACVTLAWACALLGQLDTRLSPRARGHWWLGFYAAMGVAALGKGLLAGLPAVGWMLWFAIARPNGSLFQGLKKQIVQMQLLKGALLFAAIACPWYLAMIAFDGRDQEGLVFWRRFFLHDHFDRLLSGVHTTTPGGTFVYFIEQGGYGIFPWVALLPGAMAFALKTQPGETSAQARLTLWALSSGAFSFLLFSASATKFHHYVLPVLPAIAVLIGLFIARLLEEGAAPHALGLLLGLMLFALVGRDLAVQPRHFLDLFTYNYERPYPEFLVATAFWQPWLTVKTALGAAFVLAAIATVFAALKYSSKGLLSGVVAISLGLALWLSWSHWISLSHHWTQRDLFWRYWRQRGSEEPIAAFMMDWKGETFYSRNQVVQLGPANYPTELPRFVARAGQKWILVEHSRLRMLRDLLPAQHPMRMIEPALNNKFVLVVID